MKPSDLDPYCWRSVVHVYNIQHAKGHLNISILDTSNAAFHHGLHCLLRYQQPSRTEIHQNLKILTCDKTMLITCQYVWENPSE